MMPVTSPRKRVLSTAPILIFLFLSSLSCGIGGSLQASPTPTITPSPTSTPAPTTTPTFAPIQTPKGLLPYDQRSDYIVTLRSTSDAIHERFYAISGYLQERGYVTHIDSLHSDIGDMDIILYGAPSCNDAIDDLAVILEGRLDIRDLPRSRFIPDDALYDLNYLIIQINTVERFGPGI